jgi:hypothetical protein
MYQPKFDRAQTAEKRFRRRVNYVAGCVLVLALCGALMAQAGRRAVPSSEGGVMVSVVAARTDKSASPITAKQLSVYDNGIERAETEAGD